MMNRLLNAAYKVIYAIMWVVLWSVMFLPWLWYAPERRRIARMVREKEDAR